MERQTGRAELPRLQIVVVRKVLEQLSDMRPVLDLAGRGCRQGWEHTGRIVAVAAAAVETAVGVNALGMTPGAMTLKEMMTDIVTPSPATNRFGGMTRTCIHRPSSLADGRFDRAQERTSPPGVLAVGMAAESALLSGQVAGVVVARRAVAAQAPTDNWKDHAASSDDCHHPFHLDGPYPWRARPATDRRSELDASEARAEGWRRIPDFRPATTVDFAGSIIDSGFTV